MIFFATIQLAQVVHAGCTGFVGTIYEYVEAQDKADVGKAVEAWCRNKGIKLARVYSVSIAQQQDIGKYVFPEQIIRPDGASSHRVV